MIIQYLLVLPIISIKAVTTIIFIPRVCKYVLMKKYKSSINTLKLVNALDIIITTLKENNRQKFHLFEIALQSIFQYESGTLDKDELDNYIYHLYQNNSVLSNNLQSSLLHYLQIDISVRVLKQVLLMVYIKFMSREIQSSFELYYDNFSSKAALMEKVNLYNLESNSKQILIQAL